MKNFLKENWFKIGLLAILVIFIAGVFYWFEYKPAMTYQYCNEKAKELAKGDSGEGVYKNYDYAYKACLRSRGHL
jgi:hypothetical protein